MSVSDWLMVMHKLKAPQPLPENLLSRLKQAIIDELTVVISFFGPVQWELSYNLSIATTIF